MANYCCATRSSYFRVKDADAFRIMMEKVECAEDCLRVWEEVDDNGELYFAFGCYSAIAGLPDDDDEITEDSYDNFANELKNHVIDGDAIIIFEAGNEKLRYVGGCATIVTSNTVSYIDLSDAAIAKCRDVLNNPTFTINPAY